MWHTAHGVPKGGVKKKKKCQALGHIFLVYEYLEGLDYDRIEIFHVQNLEKNRFFEILSTRNFEEIVLFSAIKCKLFWHNMIAENE